LERRASELCDRAATLLGAWNVQGGAPADQMLGLVEALAGVLLTEAVDAPRAARLAALAADLQELALDLHRHETTERTLRAGGFGAELRRLHDATSSARLISAGCEEVRRSCGLERVLMSRVHDDRCQPQHANDEARSERWFATWVDGEIDLRALALEHVVAERRPDVIDTTQRENHPMVHLSQTKAYVVAPIMPAGHVVGLFQADHGRDGRPGDETDRDVLRVFTSVYGHVYERTCLHERLTRHEQHVRDTLALVDNVLDEPINTPAQMVDYPHANLDELTPRERDVLQLLAAGLRNRAIADQLSISTPTVKTHVGRILCKLGASNRSELIAHLYGRT
jgi:DNA-binding CsgD family transcriptional regulator